MTLKDLIDVSEVPLLISEDGFYAPFLCILSLDRNSSEEFKDVFTTELLSRKISMIKIKDHYIAVNLEIE